MVVAQLLPARCVACNQTGSWWCDQCASQVRLVDSPVYHHRDALNGVWAAAYFRKPLAAGVKALKYRHTRAVSEDLARYLVPPLEHIGSGSAVLVPIPLHPSRRRKRGHNQAELLARSVARQTRTPYRTDLKRIRNTPTQTELHRTERFNNVVGAFAWRGSKPPVKVILVDDVVTTGATFEAAAMACRAAGVREVWGLAVAYRERS